MFVSLRIRPNRLLVWILCAVLLVGAVPVLVHAVASQAPTPVYLTIDDGPSYVTPRLLETLKKHNVKATFFVTAQYIDYAPIIKQIAEDGHVIALHSYSHVFKQIYKSTDAFWEDMKKLDDLVFEMSGQHAAKIIRFPGGSSNTVSHRYGGSEIMRDLAAQCKTRGYTYCDWTIDTRDAVGSGKSAEFIAGRVFDVIDKVPVAVILMHDGPDQKTAPEAVEKIITRLKSDGYMFDTLDHLTTEVHHSFA